MNKISNLNTEDLTNPYWTKKTSPPLATAFTELSKHLQTISQDKIFRIYDHKLKSLIPRATIIFPEYNDIPIHNWVLTKSLLDSVNADCIIFCDGSKCKEGVGSAFTIDGTDLVYQYKLPGVCSIYTAEALAIVKCLTWCLENNIFNVAILSDSESVLQSINNLDKSFFKNRIIGKIRFLVNKLTSNQCKVVFIWVKGHAGIPGNEKADAAAKSAIVSGHVEDVWTLRDMFNMSKLKIYDKWKEKWQYIVSNKQSNYFLLHQELPTRIPHVFEYNENREYSVIISRLKTNHGNFPAHLAKIGLIESPICGEDQEYADLNHLFFMCTKNKNAIEVFMNKLKNIGYQYPLNINTLLASGRKDVYDSIVKFVRICKLSV
nr:unnamed protein product [Callosobruchus chinensis]